MEIEELAKTYAEEAVNNIAVSNLYRSVDCTDIKSNAYEFSFEADDGNLAYQTVTFQKYASEWAPFIDEESNTYDHLTVQGEIPSSSRPQDIATSMAENIYGSFVNSSNNANYTEASFLGVRKLFEDYRTYAETEPYNVVIDDDLLEDSFITGIEEIEDVQIYQSQHLDLGNEILVSGDRFGYYLVRSPVTVNGYHDADNFRIEGQDIPIQEENPYIVQTYTRVTIAELYPDRGIVFTPFE